MAVSQLIPEEATSAVVEVVIRSGKHLLDASLTAQRQGGVEVSPFYLNVEVGSWNEDFTSLSARRVA